MTDIPSKAVPYVESPQALIDLLKRIDSLSLDALMEFGTSVSDIPNSTLTKVSLLVAKQRQDRNMKLNCFRVLTLIAEKLMPVGSYADLESCPDILMPHFNQLLEAYLSTLKTVEAKSRGVEDVDSHQ
jgi:hypothetical protein